MGSACRKLAETVRDACAGLIGELARTSGSTELDEVFVAGTEAMEAINA